MGTPEYKIWLPGETISDEDLQNMGLQGTFTPALTASTTNPTLGTGSTATADVQYHQGFVTIRYDIVFGSAGVAAGSGTYQLSLPTLNGVTLGIDADWASQKPIGMARLRDSNVPTVAHDWRFVTDLSFPTTLLIKNDSGGSVTNAVPWTWAANDSIGGICRYKTDHT